MRGKPSERPSPARSESGRIDKTWGQFVDFLKKNNYKITRARKAVLESVMARTDHFRPEDLMAESKIAHGSVSRSTIYRTLSLMAKAGLVREVSDGATHLHYEHTPGIPHHEHMVCEKCGAFIEFQSKRIESLIQHLCDQKHFKPNSHSILILGLCRKCRRAKSKRKKGAVP